MLVSINSILFRGNNVTSSNQPEMLPRPGLLILRLIYGIAGFVIAHEDTALRKVSYLERKRESFFCNRLWKGGRLSAMADLGVSVF